ncbi:hypothetical protein [Polyangium aurulentum]|uniref:hypothetical protein n=1 Tax=Polyangium aurulentum TaxID=2567896 RepID=UPI0010AEA058|nr:hypothetical protein [Polyangium aurulentum]UQA55710.1 hypothetical protein E8A73_030800 [Polyangium aurulentum]
MLRSFKLRIADRHVRIVPANDARGCPFSGPGVDLRGEDADRAIAAGEPIASALRALEPGIVIRSVSIDFERPRLLATLDPTTPEADPRPRVVRLDEGPTLRAILEATGPLQRLLLEAAHRAIAARAPEPQSDEQKA